MKPYLLASLAALLAGTLAFPARTGVMKPAHQAEAADLAVLRRASRLILVVADDFNGPSASVSLFERNLGSGAWTAVSQPMQAVIGEEGLAWWPTFESFGAEGEPIKAEPDQRTPAGVFPVGATFGYDALETSFDMPLAAGQHFCVDDTSSPLYNRIVREDDVEDDVTGERMWQLSDYRRGLVIDYPTDLERHPASCVFVHIWSGEGVGTAGCVGLSMGDVETLQAFTRKSRTAIAIVSRDTLARFRGILPEPSQDAGTKKL